MNTNASDTRKLAAYYADEFAPQQLAGTSTVNLRRYEQAIRLFLSFAGGEVAIGELSPETLDRFDAWLIDPATPLGSNRRNTSPLYRDKLAFRFGGILRRVLSYADPARFTVRQRPHKEPQIKHKPTKRAGQLAERDRYDSDAEGTLQRFFLTVYRVKRLRGKSENTVRLYHNTIRNFSHYLKRPALVTDLTDDVVCGFLDWHRTVRENSPATANKDRSQLLAIANMAAKKNLIPWLEVQPENEPERIPQAWTRDELHRLLDACLNEPGEVAGIPAGRYWHTLHLVLWNTGERIAAIMGLRWTDVDLDAGWLQIPAELRKGGKRDIIRRLDSGTVEALRSIRLPDRELIFAWHRAPTDIYRFYARILERAGLPHGRKDKFHRIRKSVASHYAAAGGNATELLDHSSMRVTKKYLDPKVVVQRHAVDLLFRLDGPKGGAA